MKPTFGLVPRTGVIPTWPYLDTHGPLARHVADAALLLDAIAALDARYLGRERETSADDWGAYQTERGRLKAGLEAALAAGAQGQ